jgi:hypothetical protein
LAFHGFLLVRQFLACQPPGLIAFPVPTSILFISFCLTFWKGRVFDNIDGLDNNLVGTVAALSAGLHRDRPARNSVTDSQVSITGAIKRSVRKSNFLFFMRPT